MWHPKAGDPWHFANPFEALGWKLGLGILLVAAGVFLVLLSKEQAEASKGAPPPVEVKPAENTP